MTDLFDLKYINDYLGGVSGAVESNNTELVTLDFANHVFVATTALSERKNNVSFQELQKIHDDFSTIAKKTKNVEIKTLFNASKVLIENIVLQKCLERKNNSEHEAVLQACFKKGMVHRFSKNITEEIVREFQLPFGNIKESFLEIMMKKNCPGMEHIISNIKKSSFQFFLEVVQNDELSTNARVLFAKSVRESLQPISADDQKVLENMLENESCNCVLPVVQCFNFSNDQIIDLLCGKIPTKTKIALLSLPNLNESTKKSCLKSLFENEEFSKLSFEEKNTLMHVMILDVCKKHNMIVPKIKFMNDPKDVFCASFVKNHLKMPKSFQASAQNSLATITINVSKENATGFEILQETLCAIKEYDFEMSAVTEKSTKTEISNSDERAWLSKNFLQFSTEFISAVKFGDCIDAINENKEFFAEPKNKSPKNSKFENVDELKEEKVAFKRGKKTLKELKPFVDVLKKAGVNVLNFCEVAGKFSQLIKNAELTKEDFVDAGLFSSKQAITQACPHTIKINEFAKNELNDLKNGSGEKTSFNKMCENFEKTTNPNDQTKKLQELFEKIIKCNSKSEMEKNKLKRLIEGSLNDECQYR